MNREEYKDLEWKYRTLGGMMSQGERQRTRELMAAYNQPTEMQRFVAENALKNREQDTRIREAELKAQGMENQGAKAAEYNKDAAEYSADRTSETEKYRIDRQKEIEAARDQTNIKIAEGKNDAEIDKVTEQNKGLGTQGEWAVKLEQERAKTEAAKAAAQEQVWKNRQESKGLDKKEYNRRIQQMVTNMKGMRKYKGKTIEELYSIAQSTIEKELGNGE